MAKDKKMWNGIDWYGFKGPTASTADISLLFIMYSCDFCPYGIRAFYAQWWLVCRPTEFLEVNKIGYVTHPLVHD